jgi:hypothetical protein
MNIRRQLSIGLALAGLALGLTTVQAKAEPVLKGTFELPAAAYWGDTLLQPGQYTIWMSTEVRDIARVPTMQPSSRSPGRRKSPDGTFWMSSTSGAPTSFGRLMPGCWANRSGLA